VFSLLVGIDPVRPRLAFPEWISSPAENCVIIDLPLDRFQSKLFEQLFEEVVARCLEAGLVEGDNLLVDGSFIEANANKESRILREQLAELGACDRGCRFGVLGCGGLCWLGRSRLGPSMLRLISLLLCSADLHAAFQKGSILYADPLGDRIARQRAFAADVQTVRALDVALHLAQDHDFAGTDIGGNAAVASNGHAAFGKIDGALDAAIDVQRFGAAHFTLDDH